MKPVDHATLDEGAEPSDGPASAKADALSMGLKHAKGAELLQCFADALEHGVILWSAAGLCELVGEDVNAQLELGDFKLQVGSSRNDFLDHMATLGSLDEDQLEMVREKYAEGVPFSSTRETETGRVLLISVKPRANGGHSAILSDITSFRQNETNLAAAKARAEKTERRLSAELARLNAEKARVEERQEELQRLSLVAAHAKDLVVITDASNRVIWVNEAFRHHNGFDLELDLVGKPYRDVLAGPDTDPNAIERIDAAVRNRQSSVIELICYKRNGETYWMEQEIIPVFSEDGEHTNFIIVGRDTSERKRAEAAAMEARHFEQSKRAESRLLSDFNEWLQSSDSLEEVFVVVSAFLAKLIPGSSGAVYTYGESREVLSRACSWGTPSRLEDFELAECWALRRGRAYYFGENTIDIPCGHVQIEHGDDIPERHYCLPIIAHGDTVGLMSVAVEASSGADTQKLATFCAEHISLAIANVKLREQLREQSTRDALTGLYNRRFFIDYARREIGRCKAQHRPASLISLDVDFFKKFNDEYGHDAGDLVLRSLAKVLQQLFREADVPCRIGGEEFVVMMPGASLDRAMERAEQLRAAVEAMELTYNRERLKVTMSAGVCEYPTSGDNLEELMQVVDEALYRAKDAGRNCVVRASDDEQDVSFDLDGGVDETGLDVFDGP